MRTLYKLSDGNWVVKYHPEHPDYQEVVKLFKVDIVPTPYFNCSLKMLRQMDKNNTLLDCNVGVII